MANLKDKYPWLIDSGVCKCGCSWEDHHLGFIMNKEALDEIHKELPHHPPYLPQECEKWGWNELGGMKHNPETDQWEHHCSNYEEV